MPDEAAGSAIKTQPSHFEVVVPRSVPAIPGARDFQLARRFMLFALIAASEIFFASFLFGFDTGLPLWRSPHFYANSFAQLAFLAFPLFVMMAWPIRTQILAIYQTRATEHAWRACLSANVALFAALLLTRHALSSMEQPSPYIMSAYSGLLLATGVSLALVAAPMSFWRPLVKLAPMEIALAAAGAAFILAASRFSQDGWNSLSFATLTLSYWFLTLYEPNVLLDSEHHILEVNDFRVEIFAPCSGYEGIALILAFLSIYTWVFRRELRFPNALLLFPIGIAAIWILNAARIAVLVSIGGHISPAIALEGFHSQGGWIAFLIVTLTVIWVSRSASFFTATAVPIASPVAAASENTGARITLEYLAPFLALMAASVIASAFAPHEEGLYAIKVAAIAIALWWFRDAYVSMVTNVSPLSIAAGVGIGIAWIATDPVQGTDTALGAWITSLPVWLAGVWLALRVVGGAVLVPVAEELAFRGFLSRALISTRFETVGIGEFRLLAFVGSSLAFGLMHERWVAACLAGAVYALLMYRTKRLSDPIAAHMASNAMIIIWAVATRQWSLL
ncbi:exosortase E/protease, VPEID-CTERM system [Hyphomicrobium sp. CS1GBMeth3]|uniref:exosortase E/protease, VPEID-CTERM system n=1 Tax=Hyphomicrobium sp. CS1GBMeth3 TaxID=1892845 RepID=UPI00093145A3|nr:exosortase E/protease, VPEID-CTERM system [Hyphomicrobium sp. CS1GBMeth3]